MNKLNAFDWLALVLVIVGGLNWGLVGIFKFDLVYTLLDLLVFPIIFGVGAT